ncbi:MAG: DUF1345 domain-containing protein [Fimbriimonadaceae bacterium]|nr:DUF1345 domain-containing protein [Chitinophagales bacterium]
MSVAKKETTKQNILLRMHPLYRILLSFVFTAIVFFVFPKSNNMLLLGITLWDVFALTYIITSWIVLFSKPVSEIKKSAAADDGSKIFVFVLVIISAFASMLTVLLLVISKDAQSETAFLPAVIAAILLSWVMVHTVFAFHYAHMFYDDGREDDKRTAEGLIFPEEKKPDYIDFAYFSFVIGCTFQVSDVAITSRTIRRLVLLHGLISFLLNTFVVALTINLIAGLGN